MVTALLHGPVWLQTVLFVVVSTGLLLALRPLVELGYLSNTAECRKLADSSYQDLLAQTIADGILQDLGLGRKKTEA